MDLSDPTRAIIPTLDGPVLAVLAAAGRPLTVGQVAQQAARGSEIGIRRSLARLVAQGIVRAIWMGRNQVHELNRDHIAADVATALADLRPALWERFRVELRGWKVKPLLACVFGSAARGDGDESSDVDLLLVHPPFPGEPKPARLNSALRSQIADALGTLAPASETTDAARQWESQLEGLRGAVESWTGNPLQIVDMSFHEWRQPAKPHRALLSEIGNDGVELVKARALADWRAGAVADG
jgi:predicted nucleotidyltransferase